MSDFNAQVIDEFRANDGVVGGYFEGKSLLLLHNTGAKSGMERIAPLVYQPVGNAYAVFASKAGATTNPDWFHNLVANPHASVEVGGDRIDVTARVLDTAEREPVWERQKAADSQFADYEKKTNRQIPVILLERR